MTALAALLLAAPSLGLAQAASSGDTTDASACLGFSFGPWNPPLDWRLAGHDVPVDSARVPRAPGGRGWASPNAASRTDTTLMLFPAWWPVGVEVAFNARGPARGDTVSGHATALVADGRREAPTSRVRVWQVPCGRSP
jgi:hypothetical protein